MQEPLASWNPKRDVWETEQMDLFSGHSDVFSETWPVSGMTRSGLAFELPTWEPPTSGTGCSSLPTPRATRGGSSTETTDLLRTPMSNEAEKDWIGPRMTSGHQEFLSNQISELLPTPVVKNNENRQSEGYGPNLMEAIRTLFPTPTTRDWKDGGPQTNVPTNSLLGREIWDMPEGWSLHRGDALYAEDWIQTAPTATSSYESDTPGAASSPPSDAGS